MLQDFIGGTNGDAQVELDAEMENLQRHLIVAQTHGERSMSAIAREYNMLYESSFFYLCTMPESP